jgi:hypothetical protein
MLAFIAVVALTTALWSPGRAVAADAGSPRASQRGSQHDVLRERATGAWSGDYGTLEFRADGTATFTIHNCGVSETTPGFGEVDAACDSTAYSGKVSVEDHGYGITDSEGGTVHFGAYVDDDGALHVGVGTVGAVAANRTGTVELWLHDTLKIGTGTCTWAPFVTGKKLTAKCAYRTGGGRTVLVFRAPDEFAKGKTELRGLVLVPDARLLVDPGLVPLVYTRS